MPRFFAEILEFPKAVIRDKPSIRHISGPLRKRKGDLLSIRDLNTGYEARIASLESQGIMLEIVSEQELFDRCRTKVHLGMCLIDPKEMEDAVRSATELGVCDIFPIVSGRSNIRTLSQARTERIHSIIIEAVKQCGRRSIPRLHVVKRLEEFIPEASSLWKERLVAAQGGKEILKETGKSEVGILIGPEGGFRPQELEMILRAGFIPVSLGNTTLRAGTAAVAALSVLGSP